MTPSGRSEATRAHSRRLADFSLSGYDKGRSRAVQALWFATQNLVFGAWWCPAGVRVWLLRGFGARVGVGVVIRHRVRVLWPWKLTIADNVWIGEGSWLLNLEPIEIGANSCVSQEALLCTGSHEADSPTFPYDNGPISVGSGAWICARAIVLRGSIIRDGEIVPAGSVRGHASN